MPIRRNETPNVVIKSPGVPPPPSPALMNKIASAEKAEAKQAGKEVKEAQKVAPVEAGKVAGADNVEAKKFAKQGIRGATFQPLGMDPKQAKALGVLVMGDGGVEQVEAEQALDEIWYSLSDKQRVAVGRAERFRVDMEQKMLRLTRNNAPAHVVRGQLNARSIERGMKNAQLEAARYDHLLADDTRALLARFVSETAQMIESSYRTELMRGAPSEDLADCQVDLVRKLIYQEVQSRLRRMGDRGIRHIMGNIDIQERLMEAMAAAQEVTPRDRFVGRVAQVHHDLGYCCHAAQVSYQAGRMHRHYSTRIFNDEMNRYRKVLPPKDLQRVREGVALHAHLDFNWVEDPLGSAIRVADHLMPFANHWAYPQLHEVKGSTELCRDLHATAKGTEKAQFEVQKTKLWDAVNKHTAFSMNFKEDLLSGLRAIEHGAYVVELGPWAGEFDGCRFDAKTGIMEVAVKPDARRASMQAVFDCGQDQLFYFLRKRGVTDDALKQAGPLDVRCREQGPVALRIVSGSLPQKKLNFKVRR